MNLLLLVNKNDYRQIDLFSSYVLVCQCRSTTELLLSNVAFFTCIFTHNLWEDKGSNSPGTFIGKTKLRRVSSLYQNEVKCLAFDMEMIFHSYVNKTHFHKKGCALGLISKVRVFGTRKWHISCCPVITKFTVQFHVKLGFWGSPHVRISEPWILYSTSWFQIPGTGFWSQWNLDSGFWLLVGFLILKPRIPVPQLKFPRFVIPQDKNFIGIGIPLHRVKWSCSTALNGCSFSCKDYVYV